MSCVAWKIDRTARPAQKTVRLPLGTTAAIASIPAPRMICISHSHVRFRPKRSTSGLHKNLSVTAPCSADVIPTCAFEAPIAVRYSAAIWCRKLQGSPSPKYVVDVHSRSFLGLGASLATVQRWSGDHGGAASFFPGGGALRRGGKPWPA